MPFKLYLFLSFFVSTFSYAETDNYNNIPQSFDLPTIEKKGIGIVIFSTVESGSRSQIEPYLYFKRLYTEPHVDGKVIVVVAVILAQTMRINTIHL